MLFIKVQEEQLSAKQQRDFNVQSRKYDDSQKKKQTFKKRCNNKKWIQQTVQKSKIGENRPSIITYKKIKYQGYPEVQLVHKKCRYYENPKVKRKYYKEMHQENSKK